MCEHRSSLRSPSRFPAQVATVLCPFFSRVVCIQPRPSGLYLKLVTRVYLIEEAGFRWYSLLEFLCILVAKRPFIVSFQKR
jgi:hypothetical protein